MNAIGNIGGLTGIVASSLIEFAADRSIGPDQGKEVAFGREFKIGGRASIGIGFAGTIGNHHEIFACAQDRLGREGPLSEVVGIIGEVPAAQVEGWPAIVDLDPVVEDSGRCVRHGNGVVAR